MLEKTMWKRRHVRIQMNVANPPLSEAIIPEKILTSPFPPRLIIIIRTTLQILKEIQRLIVFAIPRTSTLYVKKLINCDEQFAFFSS